ncbi:MAG: TraB/GumN family protein [Bacteroidota bacterium]
MKRIVVVLAVLLCLNVYGQDPPAKKYQSLLWEITGNGLETPSYLYGTMHVSDKVAFHLNDTFFAAISHCDMVALEIDAEQWFGKNQDIINARNSIEYTSTNYTSNFYKNSFTLEVPTSDDMKDMIQTYPYIIKHILYRTYDDEKNFEEDTYIDMFIYQTGKKMNKKTGGLEDFIKSEEMVNKAYEYYYSENYSDKDYEKKKIRLKELKKGYNSIYDLFDDAYRTGNLDLIDTVEKLMYPRKYLEYMVLKRNAVMANSMDSIMKYSSLFAGVGCAHLPGDSGVIDLLRKKGYTLRPVNYLSTNGIDPKIRSQLEKTRVYRDFTNQFPSDSSFSVMLPGPLSEYGSDNFGIKKYIYNDPANGSYYYIIRSNHFAKLYSQSDTYILQRIDSILYESVPGKILKKEISYSNNGYPGYNIENETETGDRQQYRIYITPDEIILFKMSGTGDYIIYGNEAETFFNSITFYRTEGNNFSEFPSKTGGYRINFPVNKCYYISNDPGSERRELLTSASVDNNEYYFLMCSRLFDFSYIEEDTFELNMLAETFAESIGYGIQKRYFLKVNSHPALNTILIKDGKEAEIRIVISGPFYYLAGCIGDDQEKRQNYLNSFELQEICYNKPFRNYSDTVLQFSTKMPFEENELMKLVKSENSYYEYSYVKNYKKLIDYLPVDK